MSEATRPLGITDVVFRDAHQSLFATRLRLEDMLPVAEQLDDIGFWSLETWGGATFDACIRFLGEDPWERLRELKKVMPKTRQQMLLRGQNLLGYRHYADDMVDKFVERAVANGMDVFRVFDAMNDPRNLDRAMRAVKKQGAHAQGTLSYTTSPVHTLDSWIDLACEIESLGADSLCIKDMAGIMTPYDAYELVSKLKQSTSLEIQLHCHATSGLSSMTILKAVEAGVDRVDTAISSMSMTYGHSPTESIIATLKGTERDTGLDLKPLEAIASHFRGVRKKYAGFEGALKGIDSRILTAQVPGGMLTNLESQLREQGASDRFDEVLNEIPRVREDLGFIPLVTPTSQIVGTQAVLNVLTGQRYQTISKETRGILKGEYGAAPAPFNQELQAQVLNGNKPVTCRPADLLDNEMDKITAELQGIANDKGVSLAADREDDVLTYAMFPQVGLKFLENRNNTAAFEPAPDIKTTAVTASSGHDSESSEPGIYTVKVNGNAYLVEVMEGGELTRVENQVVAASPQNASGAEVLPAPLAGNIWKILVKAGDTVSEGDVLLILEAMKMETEVKAPRAGQITSVNVKEGASVAVGDSLLSLS
ncbi:sodium-extruding oxaloacetate decarboxylase subunit alpha [Endozoicomonas sp. Mp262]|uniref:sodium-extruding oxaloacetate decarboxylase subunit alpha n=1 Tax=Endozoicomonas sp. Mp262 TaxID=2919499 RepID=UPI0021D9D511